MLKLSILPRIPKLILKQGVGLLYSAVFMACGANEAGRMDRPLQPVETQPHVVEPIKDEIPTLAPIATSKEKNKLEETKKEKPKKKNVRFSLPLQSTPKDTPRSLKIKNRKPTPLIKPKE